MSDSSVRIGIDLGGTKTEIIALDGGNGKEMYRKRIPTEKKSYEKIVHNILGLITEAEKESGGHKATVGIGMPGCISADTGLVKGSNITLINGRPLQQDLEKKLKRPVKIENDANCLAVSEAVDGAAAGAPVVFGVIIGTGCGGGIAINGKPIPGRNKIAGEWGHLPLPYPRFIGAAAHTPAFAQNFELNKNLPVYEAATEEWLEYPGDSCYCGRRGCLETWISGTGFKNDYKRVVGEEISTHDIIANAKKGEENAVKALERYTDRLARALAGIIHLLDPDVIVLGGGMSNVDSLYKDIPAIWGNYICSDFVHTKLLPPRYGDSSGVRGAAWL